MPTEIKKPRYLEYERFRRSVNRKMWAIIGVQVLTNFLCIGVALVALAKPIPVIAFDQEGRAILFRDTTSPRTALEDKRLKSFAELFVRRYVGLSSGMADRDFAEALNMMTPRLRTARKNDDEELARLFRVKGAEERVNFSHLEVKYFDEELSNPDTQKLHVTVWGSMRHEPVVGAATEEDVRLEYFRSSLILERCPMDDSEISNIYGFLVDAEDTKLFETAEDFRLYHVRIGDAR